MKNFKIVLLMGMGISSLLFAQPHPEHPSTQQAFPRVPSATHPHPIPPVPWARSVEENYPPGRPYHDYNPVFVPNGATLPWKLLNGVKVFHLTAEPIVHEVVTGLKIKTWGLNGHMPGPVIEAVQGDRVRIYVTNRLPVKTSIHWHSILLPSGMDGVMGLTQPAIKPGETFVYEFFLPDHGTFMYHSHFDSMTQEGMGVVGMIVVHPRDPRISRPDRDFAILLHEWRIDVDTARPFPWEMIEFNVLTMNGKAFPDTYPLVAQLGDRVRIRLGNLGQMSHHPIHLHGYAFKITATDGGPIPESAQWPETTVLVHVGSSRTIEFLANNPGDWLMHCHMTHHMMNQMGHDLPNMVGVEARDVEKQIRRFLPKYMIMGEKGMMPLQEMKMPIPENSVPMFGFKGQFGQTDLGSMVTVLKVRPRGEAPTYQDPGPYHFPPETLARKATPNELDRDGVILNKKTPPPQETSKPKHQH